MANFDMSGFGRFFDQLEGAAQPESIPLNELLPGDFLQEHVGVESIEALLRVAGLSPGDITSVDDLNIEPINEILRQFGIVGGVNELLQKAVAAYLRRKIGM